WDVDGDLSCDARRSSEPLCSASAADEPYMPAIAMFSRQSIIGVMAKRGLLSCGALSAHCHDLVHCCCSSAALEFGPDTISSARSQTNIPLHAVPGRRSIPTTKWVLRSEMQPQILDDVH